MMKQTVVALSHRKRKIIKKQKFLSFNFYSAAGAFFDAALAALDARSRAEALAAAARLRSGLSEAAALPAEAATRRGEIFFETEVDERLAGLVAFLGRETVTATPPPGAAVTSTVFSLARPEGGEGGELEG